ncbi:MAG: hypothetical protein AB7G23_01800 [Vicinamibacterales bacterium]
MSRNVQNPMRPTVLAALALALLLAPTGASAQGRRGGGPPPVPRQAAPIDLTGTWVSIVTEDWRFRMMTPPKGDYNSVPLNAEGRRVADTWDPARDRRSGEECRWYGAASIMSVPGRVKISWADDATLRMETDAGMQTRLFHFGGAPPARAARSWQGYSTARWRASRGGMEPGSLPGGSLEVHTSNLRPGYLRRNGVPYSQNADLTEYYYVLEDAGTTWMIVITVVEDPMYLAQPFVTSRQFMKQADDAGWNPSPCTAG